MILEATPEVGKPRAPRDALQNDLLLEDEGEVARLQHGLPDGLQRVEPAIPQMLDKEDGTLCSGSDELVHSNVLCTEARGRWWLEDARSRCELEIRDGELGRKLRSITRTAIDKRRSPRGSTRTVLISTEVLDLTSNLSSQ